MKEGWSGLFEEEVEALCEQLRRIGLNATVESKKPGGFYPIFFRVGSVRVVNRNIDLVELQLIPGESGGYRCNYLVQVKVNGLEDMLKAKGKPVRKSYLSREVVDFKWKGKKLAQVLNDDANLRNMLLRMGIPRYLNANVQIKPDKKHQRVKIRPIDQSPYPWRPEAAGPSALEFEAYDRIAQHVRSIATVRP